MNERPKFDRFCNNKQKSQNNYTNTMLQFLHTTDDDPLTKPPNHQNDH